MNMNQHIFLAKGPLQCFGSPSPMLFLKELHKNSLFLECCTANLQSFTCVS